MFSGNICLFSFSSKLMFGAKSREHLSWTLCFHITHSSGSPWLLNALFVITDSSRGNGLAMVFCFVKETTLCAPTLTLWLTQSYILTHARAFNIESRILGLELRRLISISWCDSLIGVDKSCIFAIFRGILVLWETIYANNDTAKYTAKIDSYISVWFSI